MRVRMSRAVSPIGYAWVPEGLCAGLGDWRCRIGRTSIWSCGRKCSLIFAAAPHAVSLHRRDGSRPGPVPALAPYLHALDAVVHAKIIHSPRHRAA